MRPTLARVLWFIAVGVISTVISARVNAACDGGENNWGLESSYVCVERALDCNGDTCETDYCGQQWRRRRICFCHG